MIRLSIPVRQALSRLTLPVLIAVAFGVMLLGKADALLAERARMALADALALIVEEEERFAATVVQLWNNDRSADSKAELVLTVCRLCFGRGEVVARVKHIVPNELPYGAMEGVAA